MIIRTEEMIGKKFGRLTVLERADDYMAKSGKREAAVLCKCDCGNTKRLRASVLKNGNTRSCGCYRREASSMRNSTHGLSHSRIWNTWCLMIERCERENNKSYKNYGAKGIRVCDEWHKFENFVAWAMTNGYDETLTIDRVDSSKDYCPENCRWADRKTQNNNTSRNHWITFDGQTKTMAQWSEITGISYAAIKSRLNKHGWSVERALTTPVT